MHQLLPSRPSVLRRRRDKTPKSRVSAQKIRTCLLVSLVGNPHVSPTLVAGGFLSTVQLMQQDFETDTWLLILNIPGQSPQTSYGPTGSNLLTATPVSSVYVDTPTISLSTLDLSVNLNLENIFLKSSAGEASSTIALFAALTTPDSNGAVVWVVQVEIFAQIQKPGVLSASASGSVLYEFGNTGAVIPFEQYSAAGQNELRTDDSSFNEGSTTVLPSYCANTTLGRDCRISSTLGYFNRVETTITLGASFEHTILPTTSPKITSYTLTQSPQQSPKVTTYSLTRFPSSTSTSCCSSPSK